MVLVAHDLLGERELDPQRDQPLLAPVVQIALDPPRARERRSSRIVSRGSASRRSSRVASTRTRVATALPNRAETAPIRMLTALSSPGG
jgi:hypothetical protein